MKNTPNIDLEIVIGIPFTYFLTVFSADGVQLDTTGDTYTASMVTWIGKTAVASFTAALGVDDDGQSAIELTMDAATTGALTPGIYRWDCIMTDTETNDRFVIAQGKAKVFDTATTP